MTDTSRVPAACSIEAPVTNSAPRVDGTQTVNEAIDQDPRTIAVFNRFGIDACCGGSVPIVDAARRDGVDPAMLVAELNAIAMRP
jgi:iron-sulfur cluster repair protein YtfE (RIC family)